MRPAPTASEAKVALNAHAAAKGEEFRQKYGPLGWAELQRLVADPACVRFPTEIRFDCGPLLEGELAHPVPKGKKPEEGFTLCIHPFFATDPRQAVYAALYQLVVINYGPFASPEDAEAFGASALGISTDEYYQALCQMADALATHYNDFTS